MRALALAVLLIALDRKLPANEYHMGDLLINGALQAVALAAFAYCVISGI